MFSDVLLTVDFDRTLTAPDSSIPERNLEAIRYFMANGGTFTVNTGRSIPMIRDFQDRVPVNAPLLLYNGSAAYDLKTRSIVFCHKIDLDLWTMIRTWSRQFPDMIPEVQGLDYHYCFTENPKWVAFCEQNDCAWAMAHPEDDLEPFLKAALYGEIRKPTVSGLFEGSPEEMARIGQVQQELLRDYGDHIEVFRSAPRILDIHAKGVSKGRSALELKEKLGKKILVCVGDGENDVPMLEAADHAFCPGDSSLTDRYTAVCSCGEGAVADVIYQEIPKLI